MIPWNWMPFLRNHYGSVIFFASLLLPVSWAFRFDSLPIQDLPNHLANASILLNYHSSDFYQKFFELKLFPFPYVLQDLILCVLLTLIPGYAANIFVALCMVAAPLGLFYLNRVVNPDKPHLVFFSLPLIWNTLLLKGNFNYLLGLALVLIGLGMLWKRLFIDPPERHARWLPFFVCLGLMYLAHLVAFALFLVLAAIATGYKRFGTRRYFYPAFILLMALLAVSGIVMTGWSSPFKGDLAARLISDLLDKINEPGNLVSFFHLGDCGFLIPGFLGMALLFALSCRQFKQTPLPFLLVITLGVLYLFSPTVMGPLVRPYERVLCLLLFLAPISFTNVRFQALERIAVPVLCLAVFGFAFNYLTISGKTLSTHIGEGRALLRQVPPEKKLLPLNVSLPYLYRIGVWNFVGAYYVVDGRGYVPCLASEKYMVVRYRDRPEFKIHDPEPSPEQLRPYDYLFVWGHNEKTRLLLEGVGFGLVDSVSGYGLYKKGL